MEMKDKETKSKDFNVNSDQQLTESTDYQKFIEEIISNLQTLITDYDLTHQRFLLEIEILERENVQLKSSQTDLKRQVTYVLRAIEINNDGDDFDFVSEDRTLDEYVSNKLLTFKNIEKLQEQNQNLMNLRSQMTKLEKFQCRINVENYLMEVADKAKHFRQNATELQHLSDVIIETLKAENEILQKENAFMKNTIVHIPTCVSEIQLKRQEFKKELLNFRQDFSKFCEQYLQIMNDCVNQFVKMLNEWNEMSKNNRKLIDDVKMRQEISASQLACIQSLKKHNEDLTKDKKNRQTTLASYLEQIQSLEKQNQIASKLNEDFTDEIKIKKSKIPSYLEQLASLEKPNGTEDLTGELKIQDSKIASYLEQIEALEKQYQTTTKQNVLLTQELTIMKQKLPNVENHTDNLDQSPRTNERCEAKRLNDLFNKKKRKMPPDDISVNAIDATSKRPNELDHCDQLLTTNKRRKSQCTSDAFNERNNLEQATYSDGKNIINLFIATNSSHVPYDFVRPVRMIHFTFNQQSRVIEVPEDHSETSGKSGIETTKRGIGTSHNLRQVVKKKKIYD